MKRYINILLAVAVMLSVSAPAFAKIEALPRLTWNRGISSYGLGVTDSTRISFPAPGAAVDFTDTTAWVDLNNLNIADQTYTGQNLVWFQVNRGAVAATDSVGYSIHYTNDLDSGASGVTASTVAYVTSVSGQDILPLIPAIAPASTLTTAPLARYIRLVVLNADVSSAAVGRQYFSVRPVILKK